MGKGAPLHPVKILIQWRNDTCLRSSRSQGVLGPYIDNDVGVFRGIPVCAQLFIICADAPMEVYVRVIENTKIAQTIIAPVESHFRKQVGFAPNWPI